MIEVWKDVVEYQGSYQVSNIGRVRSLERLVEYSDGRQRMFPAKELNCRPNIATGYVQIGLSRKNTIKQAYVHRLVAEAFLPVPSIEKKSVNHIDGNRHNNCADNLEWVTHAENIRHAHATGLAKTLCGNQAPNRVISSQDAHELREDVMATVTRWALRNGVHVQTAWDIIAKRSWAS